MVLGWRLLKRLSNEQNVRKLACFEGLLPKLDIRRNPFTALHQRRPIPPQKSIFDILFFGKAFCFVRPSTAVRFQRQQSVDRRRVVASRVTGINSKTKSIPYGRVRPMAPDSEKRGTMLSRSPGMLEDSDPGFQAIVPFQGFAAFAYQGGNGRADAPHNRSLESQTSSTVGSHNSSASKR